MGQEQNIKTFENALKENYLPVWQNMLNIEPSALLSKIKKPKCVSNKITASAPIGLSGGFGFGEEGKSTPQAGNVMFERFTTEARDMYSNVEISVKATKLTGTKGAMANALDTEVKGSYDTAKWNVGRALFGNGTGKLTNVIAQTTKSRIVKVTDCKYLKEGLIVDFYATGATTVDDAVTTGRIIAVSRQKDANGYYQIMLRFEPDTAIPAGFMTVQQSYNREITGIGAIFDDTIDKIYGISKTDNPFLKPITVDANDNIDDGTITGALRDAEDNKNSKIDMLLCGNKAYDEYANYLRVNNVRVEHDELTGGFQSIKFAFSNRIVNIVNEKFVPDDEMWGVETSKLEFHQTGWDFAQLQGGGIFNLRENNSVYRALLTNYGDLICSNPGGLVRIYNCI